MQHHSYQYRGGCLDNDYLWKVTKVTAIKKPANSKIVELFKLKMGNKTEIAESLGIARKTLYEWIDKDPDLKEAIEAQEEANIDFTESKLFSRIEGYEHEDVHISNYQGTITETPLTKHYPPDPTSIIFYLKTRAKHRGYVERQEITGKDGSPIEVQLYRLPDGTEIKF